MNALFSAFGALDWKPVLGALVLPPVPLLVLLVFSLWLRAMRRPILGAVLLALSLLALWFSHCRVTGDWLERRLLRPPPAIGTDRLATLRRAAAGQRPVVLVLGGGRESYAPEYGDATLSALSLERLHYGIWLSRRLDAALMVSGGVGHGQRSEVAEATVAARMAERDYGRQVRWLETQSTDTRGNARMSLPVLASNGLTEVFLVTHSWHMPRAVRAFEEAAALGGVKLHIVPAPVGSAKSSDSPSLDWLPSSEGYQRVRAVLREAVGLLAGA